MFRFLQTIGSFAVIVGMYVLYDRLAVPMMLPEREVRFLEPSGPDGSNNELAPYFSLFPADDWERDPEANVQKLVNDQTIILFREDTIDGNIVKLEPCTIIFLDKDPELSEEERIRQAFVMRSPQYAAIEFDGEVNFSRWPLPKIKGGTLFGKVTIYSDRKEPGPQDDIHLETENVVFTETPARTSISTLKDVAFRWGSNTGEGSVLQLDFSQLDSKNKASPKELRLLKFDSLKRLNMVLSDKDGLVAFSPPKAPVDPAQAASTPLGPATQLDIQCKREFRFVPDEKKPGDWNARFYGNVSAVRTHPDGSTDHLLCEELHVLFTPKPQDPKAKPVNQAGPGSMEPTEFLARGKMGLGNDPPVRARLTAMQNGGIVMEGDQIRYDLRKNQLVLETEKVAGASKEVSLSLENNRYILRSTQGFLYTMNPVGGIGRLESSSPGTFQGTLGEGDQVKKVSASWKSLLMEPYKFDPKQVVVQMEGGVRFDMQGLGKMTAETFHLWCFVSPTTSEKTADAAPFQGIGTLTPDCAKALGKVHFENESGTCNVNQMDIYFEAVAPDGQVEQSRRTPWLLCEGPPNLNGRTGAPIAIRNPVETQIWIPNASQPIIQQVQHREPLAFDAPPQPRPAAVQPAIAGQGGPPPVLPSGNPAAPKSADGSFFGLRSGNSRSIYAITGDRLKMLVRNESGRSEPQIIHLDGNVRVMENFVGASAGEAVEILGEEIKVWDPSTPNTQILIKGQPPRDAEFRGKGVQLNSLEINIRRAENLIWSDGPGRLLANVPAQEGNGNQGTPKPGLTPLTPLGSPKPDTDHRLVVEWNERMSFDGKTLVFLGQPDQSGIRVRAVHQNTSIFADIIRVHLNRFISLFDDQSEIQAKAEFLDCAGAVVIRTVEMENNQRKAVNSGEFNGVRLYLETGDFVADGPGCIRSTSLSNGKGFSVPGATARTTPMSTANELSHLYVQFHRDVRGNYLTSRVKFTGMVRCIHSPVSSWDTKLGIEDQTSVMKRGYLMNCEELLIDQMPAPGSTAKSVEMIAKGRASIDGVNNLFASAETIKYNQAKSLVILEGDAQGSATVYQGSKGTSAKKMEYNTETGSIQVLDSGRLDWK